ncbi:BT1 family protein [Besnoitia besnoiti]|uniref:BT1 family protein n=1 Tax=Besnoitia besnoiti TaxID=94643 RepID=A0A2A9ML55_BESBE|nr:BT1 family protein [Besnoitia besnoiti]PFH36746.1 BT1 family protein [Besnoitia besnoiti]
MVSFSCCLAANPVAAMVASGCWGRCVGKEKATSRERSRHQGRALHHCTCSRRSGSAGVALQSASSSVGVESCGADAEAREKGGLALGAGRSGASSPLSDCGRRSTFVEIVPLCDPEEGGEQLDASSLARGSDGDSQVGRTAGGVDERDAEKKRRRRKKGLHHIAGARSLCPTCGGLMPLEGETMVLVPPEAEEGSDISSESSAMDPRPKTCRERTRDQLEYINPVNIFRFAGRVRRHVGTPFFLLLLSVFGGIRGILYGLTHRSLLPYLKSVGQDAGTYQGIDALGTVIWGMMGVVGTISDSVPLGGYHKRYYMLIANVVGVCGVSLLAFVPANVVSTNVWIVGLGVFLVCSQMSTLVLMCSGKYSELMEQNREVKGDIVTFVFMCWMIGNLIGTSIVGPISDAVGTQSLYYLALPVAAQSFIPIFLGFLPEAKVPFQILTTKLWNHKWFLFLAIAIGVSATGVVIITIAFPGESLVMIPYCCLVSVLLIVLCLVCLPPELAKCNLYLFLWGLVNVSISGALDFFYTASPTCIPDGPHFDYTYYATYISVVGTLANWAGIWVFHSFLADWTFRHVFWLSIAVRAAASLFDYILVLRLNVYVGIPDKFMYLFGDAIILNLVNTLNHMPGYILTSRLCPKGMESTAYAVMDGMSHMGWNFSKQFGIFATSVANISTGEHMPGGCDFRNLGNLTLITQVALPLFAIPLSFLLLPNSPMSSRIQHDFGLFDEKEEKELELEDISEGSTKCGVIKRWNSTNTSVGETVNSLPGLCTPGATSACASENGDGDCQDLDGEVFVNLPSERWAEADDVEMPRTRRGSAHDRRVRVAPMESEDVDLSGESDVESVGWGAAADAAAPPTNATPGLLSPLPTARPAGSPSASCDDAKSLSESEKYGPASSSQESVLEVFHPETTTERDSPRTNLSTPEHCAQLSFDAGEERAVGVVPAAPGRGAGCVLVKEEILDFACDPELQRLQK